MCPEIFASFNFTFQCVSLSAREITNFLNKVCCKSPRTHGDKSSIILNLYLFQKDDPYMLESMTEV